jgi:hypothetical protein
MYVYIPDDSFLASGETATVSKPQLFTVTKCIKEPSTITRMEMR